MRLYRSLLAVGAVAFIVLGSSTAIADSMALSTSRFYLLITEPCPRGEDEDGPTWCEQALFRLVRKSDCKEFKPHGRHLIRGCADSPGTPCGDNGHEFHLNGVTYNVDAYSLQIVASDRKGKRLWAEVATTLPSPNPSFHWTGQGCSLAGQ
jgi:hypothetical protein